MSFTEEQKIQSFLKLQRFIQDKQSNQQPFFVGRLSGNETRLTGEVLSNVQQTTTEQLQHRQNLYYQMLFGAGIQFLTTDDIKTYVKTYSSSCKNSQLLGIWDGGMYIQAKPFYDFIDKMYPSLEKICAHSVEPFYFMNHPEYNFHQVFKSKRVLIITSHKETTAQQLPKLSKIFPNNSIFHETTTFHIYKPPQQNGGNHDTQSWTVHFERMKTDLKEIQETEFDFDIALVSCGGFGMPISDYIFTNLGKSVMYIGGALQLYFGIIGARWEHSPQIKQLINESWTRPVQEDKPPNPQSCEGGCYW